MVVIAVESISLSSKFMGVVCVCLCARTWAVAHVTRQHSVRGFREVTFKVCAKGSFFVRSTEGYGAVVRLAVGVYL